MPVVGITCTHLGAPELSQVRKLSRADNTDKHPDQIVPWHVPRRGPERDICWLHQPQSMGILCFILAKLSAAMHTEQTSVSLLWPQHSSSPKTLFYNPKGLLYIQYKILFTIFYDLLCIESVDLSILNQCRLGDRLFVRNMVCVHF